MIRVRVAVEAPRATAMNCEDARHGLSALVGGPILRYNEFGDGLARIGSWQLEAARFPLPDAVHMTIRVNE